VGFEGEDTFESIADAFFAEAKGDGVFFAGDATVKRKAQLKQEEFLEDQALLRGRTEFI